MLDSLIFLGIIFIFLGVCVGIRNNTNPIPTIMIVVGIIICFCAIAPYESNDKPTALDVYQGKTTLEITYRDNIPVDSVVVYKNK